MCGAVRMARARNSQGISTVNPHRNCMRKHSGSSNVDDGWSISKRTPTAHKHCITIHDDVLDRERTLAAGGLSTTARSRGGPMRERRRSRKQPEG